MEEIVDLSGALDAVAVTPLQRIDFKMSAEDFYRLFPDAFSLANAYPKLQLDGRLYNLLSVVEDTPFMVACVAVEASPYP